MEKDFLTGEEELLVQSHEEEMIMNKKLCAAAEDGGDSVNEDEVSVEYASDEMEEYAPIGSRTRSARKRDKDGDFEMN